MSVTYQVAYLVALNIQLKMVTDNYQEAVIKTAQPELNSKSKHGKHKNPNYFKEYYQKNREKLIAYSKETYQVKKLVEAFSEKVKNGVKKFSFTGECNMTSPNRYKESFFIGYSIKKTRREILEEVLDRELVRLATKLTKESKCQPLKKGWTYPNFREWLTKEKLLEFYQQWSIRGGVRVGCKFLSFLDVDIEQEKFPVWLRRQLRKNMMLFLKKIGVCYIETKRGFHIPVLSDELLSNRSIYHVDSWKKVKRIVGSIQSKGKFVIGFDSPDKILVANSGKCFWQVKDIQELSQKLAKYFFTVECKEKVQQLYTDFADCSINASQEQKSDQVSKKKAGEKFFIKLAQILKWEVFQKPIQRTKPIYKVWFQQKGKSPRYFLLDTYQKHREGQLDRLPVGSVNNLVLNQGQVYQFFYGFS